MSRVVSISQSEPGLYFINVQRTHAASVDTMMQSIANPPVDEPYGVAHNSSGNGHSNSPAETRPASDTKQRRGMRR